MNKAWGKYSFGITLAVMFVIALAIMTWANWLYFAAQQAEHHQPADVFGSSGYIWQWGLNTFSNWQADFLGQGLGVVLAAYLIFRGSEQSKDSSDQVQELVQNIERQVRGPQAAGQAQSETRAQVYRGGNLRNYGLGYLLLGAFVISWALMTWMGWMNFAANQHEHGETAQLFGTSGYIWQWARQTFENWQADFLGHGLLVVVAAYLLYKGSATSREGMDRVGASLRRVQVALQGRQQTGSDGSSLYVETLPIQDQPLSVSPWKKYGLGITLVSLFLVSWILQTWTGWGYFVSQQAEHHSVADVFGASGYIWLWATDTFSNWQSDLLWTGLIVLLGAYLVYQGSAESKDGDERIEQLATSIEQRVRGQGPTEKAQQATSRHVFDDVWHNRGLAYSMIIGGVIAWALMTWTGWMNFAATQHEHGSTAQVFGTSGYIWDWARLTLENWQSDILGNCVVVVAAAYLLYRGSGMSKGSDDEIEEALQRIEQALAQKQNQGQTQRPAVEGISEQTVRRS